MVDWPAHYDAIYDALGVAATITTAGVGLISDVVVIDKTAGVNVTEAGVETVRPGCCVRAAELLTVGVDPSDLDGSSISFNSSTWRIEARHPRPSPDGEGGGEFLLILTDMPHA